MRLRISRSRATTSSFERKCLQRRLSGNPLLSIELGGLHICHVNVIMSQQAVLVLELRVAQDTFELRLLAALQPLVSLQRYDPSVLSATGVARIHLEADR